VSPEYTLDNPTGGGDTNRITDAEAEERLARTIPLNVTGAERTARMARMRSRPPPRHTQTPGT